MRVFFIPSWFPTKERPTWCNWMRAHLEMTKMAADDVVILQVNNEANELKQGLTEIEPKHFYSDMVVKKHRLRRTRFFYKKTLAEYVEELDIMFKAAVEKYGSPNVIHAHVSMPAGYGASVIGQKYNIPVVVTEHYSGFFSDIKYPWRLGVFIKKMRPNIDRFYAVSPGFKKKIEEKMGVGFADYFPNPVNIDLFRIDKITSNQNTVNLVTTGDIGHRKGTDILLKAVCKLPEDFNWKLQVIGKNESFEPVDGLKELPIIKERVTFIDRVSQEQLSSIYNHSDIFIMSSRVETANISMLEAMACGCFVVSNKIGTSETLLSEEVSEVFDNSPDELSGALQKAIKKYCKREDMSNFVQKNYSFYVLSQKLKNAYVELSNI